MLRGGSWNNNGRNCRSAYRNNWEPDDRNNNIGFRLAQAQGVTVEVGDFYTGGAESLRPVTEINTRDQTLIRFGEIPPTKSKATGCASNVSGYHVNAHRLAALKYWRTTLAESDEPYIRQHQYFPDVFPERWASGWGEDEFGLWMAFSYKGNRQQFRWCEPGTFMMGSPEAEPERISSETQHKVTFTKGFWIADTTVTQGLWEAVMGGNPSHFKGENRPVENVSWDDAQSFINKVNGMKPELQLRLPTEAQWEYACRAASTTPFCWGEQINSQLVNFRGTSPYNNGRKSEYREETVDVKSFYQNDWGLWQTHGNVDEWCQDWYGDYPAEPVVDPQGPESGDDRVLRGGSWSDGGRFCRSACRIYWGPDVRNIDFGFRLAQGH